jgi:uncharacterized protein (DUF4415 family)
MGSSQARSNLRKHGVHFADAVPALEDESAISICDEIEEEERWSVMKKEYDFSKGKRGAVLSVPPEKTRVTIRLDQDILAWFRQRVDDAGGGNYQTLINEALETTLRRVIRDELRQAG